MILKRAILHLENMMSGTGLELSPQERASISLALIVLKTRNSHEEALIDAILALEPE